MRMGKPPGMIERLGPSPEIDREKQMAENPMTPKAEKGMYVVIIIVCIILFALVGIGLHIPTGG